MFVPEDCGNVPDCVLSLISMLSTRPQQCCCILTIIFAPNTAAKVSGLTWFQLYTHIIRAGRNHACVINVRVKCEDLSSKLYRVRMTRMCAPIVNFHQRVNSLTLLPSILLCRRKPSFQTSTAFLSKTESWHTLLSLDNSLQCSTIKILQCIYVLISPLLLDTSSHWSTFVQCHQYVKPFVD